MWGSMSSAPRAQFNPMDSNTIATTGPKFFKLWRYADGQLKSWNVNLHKGREHQVYTDHTWLAGDEHRLEPTASALPTSPTEEAVAA